MTHMAPEHDHGIPWRGALQQCACGEWLRAVTYQLDDGTQWTTWDTIKEPA